MSAFQTLKSEQSINGNKLFQLDSRNTFTSRLISYKDFAKSNLTYSRESHISNQLDSINKTITCDFIRKDTKQLNSSLTISKIEFIHLKKEINFESKKNKSRFDKFIENKPNRPTRNSRRIFNPLFLKNNTSISSSNTYSTFSTVECLNSKENDKQCVIEELEMNLNCKREIYNDHLENAPENMAHSGLNESSPREILFTNFDNLPDKIDTSIISPPQTFNTNTEKIIKSIKKEMENKDFNTSKFKKRNNKNIDLQLIQKILNEPSNIDADESQFKCEKCLIF